MGESLAQTTREVASDIADLEAVSELVKHDGSIGSIDFHMSDDKALSSNRVNRLTPEGWRATMVVTDESYTSAYIERDL